mgnify:FL=1
MNRQEFVDRLKVSLSGKVSPGQVEENARYYEDYINTRIRLGETEESVMRELGDPRLIARSIVAAESGRTGDSGEDQVYGGGEEENRRRSGRRQFFRLSGMPSWGLPVLAGGVLLFLLVVLGLLFRLVLHMLAWLWPLMAIAIVVIFFIKLFRDWLH